MPNRLLVVDGDAGLAQDMADRLRLAGYAAKSASDRNEALASMRTFRPDLVLLDPAVSTGEADELFSVLYQGGRCAMIVLAAKATKAVVLHWLWLGADDLLAKPADFDELTARIHAVLRRSRHGLRQIRIGSVMVDFDACRAASDGREIHLTQREFDVLGYLAERRGRVVYREELLNELWGYLDIPATRSVDHSIARLRKKIEPDPHRPRFLRTAHGDGYILSVAPEDFGDHTSGDRPPQGPISES